MEMNDYQIQARKTAIYPNLGDNIVYPVLGLVGESGEVAEKLKKVIRDSDGILTSDKKNEMAKELGDVMWYVANCCSELGWDLADVAQMNIDKLNSRQERGVLTGSGDNR